jgi:hypothetical protein
MRDFDREPQREKQNQGEKLLLLAVVFLCTIMLVIAYAVAPGQLRSAAPGHMASDGGQ